MAGSDAAGMSCGRNRSGIGKRITDRCRYDKYRADKGIAAACGDVGKISIVRDKETHATLVNMKVLDICVKCLNVLTIFFSVAFKARYDKRQHKCSKGCNPVKINPDGIHIA